ncbi:MAG TPA: DEAD/DEAH box helicase [Burkholderiaceae bacterium]|nr:DEAD/DEAH box helicase [Burkholderiaceae bacterium]
MPAATAPSPRPVNAARAKAAEPRVSRTRPSAELSIEEWQIRLRKQFGRDQNFKLENLGTDPVFSEFAVTNPATGGRYRVAVRGPGLGENYCSCPDFATNELGTCKHVEFTLARLARRRGKELTRSYLPPYSEIHLHYGSARNVRFRAGSTCPPGLMAKAARIFDQSSGWTLPSDRVAELPRFLADARKFGHEVRCYDDVLAFTAEVRDAQNRRRVLDAAYPNSKKLLLKGLLAVDLYPYQAQGALFAVRAGRALLADEMGLGKTVQAIAAAELMHRHFGVERVLVVCPTSIKHQWQREFARCARHEPQVIGGPRAARQQQYRDPVPIKITNYDTLARDRDLIGAWAPDLVIVDEAQRVKNWNTVAARALRRIDSAYALVLTGTPLENRLEELLSIVQFIDRHRLGPTWRLLHEHQVRDESGRVVGYRDLDRIGASLAPIMLRRRKTEVLDQLPPRIENTLFVPMTPQQRVHHDENAETVSRIVSRWRRTGYLSDADQRILTCALQNMRMSCNSTYLLDHRTDHGTKADELATLLAELFEEPGAKAVVFSQWHRMHELIARRLEANGWGYVLFSGDVPGEQRGALVDRFRDDPGCRVFLSTDAGGVGLNLQHSAATIVNMDLPWNPAVLEQRIGRVYRLGQQRTVQVVNFVSQGTIEQGMLSLLAFKKSLFAGVLDGGDSEIFLQGTRLSKFMNGLEKALARAGQPEEVSVAETAAERNPAEGDEVAPVADADAADAGSAPADASGTENTSPQRTSDGATSVNPWAPLIEAGLQVVHALSAAAREDKRAADGAEPNGSRPADDPTPWIETDARTGKAYLKLPVPEPAAVQRLADALLGLLQLGSGRK